MLFRKSLVQIFALLFLAGVTWPLTSRLHQSDLHLYYTTAEALWRGEIPYVDFPLEYPPLAAVIFCVPRVFSGFLHQGETFYRCAFALQNVLLATAVMPVILKMARRVGVSREAALLRYTVLVCALFPVVVWRFDIVPALATALAVMYLLEDRPAIGGIWLGLGVAVKLYPVVLLPLLVGYELSRRRIVGAVRLVVATGLVTVLPLAPYLAMHSTAFLSFLRYHEKRGLQIESFPAGAIELAARLKLTTANVVVEFGALHIHSPWAAIILYWQPAVMVVALVAVALAAYWQLRQEVVLGRDSSDRTLIEWAVAVLLVFMAANKVFSPQYLVWVAPLAPLLRPMLWRSILIASLITTFLFLVIYHRLKELRLDAILLLNFRNGLIVGVIIFFVIDAISGIRCLFCPEALSADIP